ncbi:hypothetical protein SCALM49S_02605 [Streptomyces californicus]
MAAAEVDEDRLAEWESSGLMVPSPDGGYDTDMVTVAKLVADLGRFGLEPRHLRAMRASADREAGLVEQLVAPLPAAPQSADQGPCGSHRERACRAVREAARGPRAERSAQPSALTSADPDYPNMASTS